MTIKPCTSWGGARLWEQAKLLVAAITAAGLLAPAAASANPFDILLQETGFPDLQINGNTPGVTTGVNLSYGNWTVTVDTGTSSGLPSIDLSSSDTFYQAGAAGSLTLTLGETGLTAPSGNTAWNTQFSGNFNSPGATVTLQSFLGLNNVMFGNTTPLSALLSATTSPFGLAETDLANIPATPFAMTLVMNIQNVSSPGSTFSLDGSLNSVPAPEPTSLLLLGTGLLGLGVFSRRRKTATII